MARPSRDRAERFPSLGYSSERLGESFYTGQVAPGWGVAIFRNDYNRFVVWARRGSPSSGGVWVTAMLDGEPLKETTYDRFTAIMLAHSFAGKILDHLANEKSNPRR